MFFFTSIISEILIVNFTSNPYELQLTPPDILEGSFVFHLSAVVVNVNGTVFPDKNPSYMFVESSEYFNLDNITGDLYFAEVSNNFSLFIKFITINWQAAFINAKRFHFYLSLDFGLFLLL